MLKKPLLTLAIAAAVSLPAGASTVDGTGSFSIGAAKTKLDMIDEGTIYGVNIKYQYEPNGSRLGFLSSFTYASGDDSVDRGYGGKADLDMRYYSFGLGPSYRVIDQVSVYGLFGFAGAKAKLSGGASVSDHFEPVFGLGVRAFPYGKIVLDAHYEKATAFNSSRYRLEADSFSVGIGLLF